MSLLVRASFDHVRCSTASREPVKTFQVCGDMQFVAEGRCRHAHFIFIVLEHQDGR